MKNNNYIWNLEQLNITTQRWQTIMDSIPNYHVETPKFTISDFPKINIPTMSITASYIKFSNVTDSIQPILDAYKQGFKRATIVTNSFHDSLMASTLIMEENFKTIHTYIANLSPAVLPSYISEESTSTLLDISIDVAEQFENVEPETSIEIENLQEAKHSLSDVIVKKTPLTFKDFMNLVLFIITLLTFLQGIMPDEQLTRIENSLNTLIELQEHEIKLLEQPREFE